MGLCAGKVYFDGVASRLLCLWRDTSRIEREEICARPSFDSKAIMNFFEKGIFINWFFQHDKQTRLFVSSKDHLHTQRVLVNS